MTWFNFTNGDITNLVLAVDQMEMNSGSPMMKGELDELSKRLRAALTPDPDDERFRNAASIAFRAKGLSEPDEIDGEAMVARSDEGAYVMAWLWVSNKDAGLRDIEIQVMPMTKHGDGSRITQPNEETHFWDVIVRETDDDDIEVLEEIEDLPSREAADLVAQAMELKYPDAARNDL